MHDEVWLRRSHTAIDGEPEVGRPRHPVLSRKHLSTPCSNRAVSRSERAAALATPTRHDRAASARAHPQPKTMHLGTAPVVGLKGPLALGHGCFSSMCASAPVAHMNEFMSVWKQSRYVRFVLLASPGA